MIRRQAGPIALLLACNVAASCTKPSNGDGNQIPPVIAAADGGEYLSLQRIATLPPAEREAWTAYLERSRADRKLDQDSMAIELRALGRDRMVRAPDVRASFRIQDWMTDAWFATDSAAQLTDIILSYQAPSGGWSKHVDYSKGRRPAGTSYFSENDRWTYIGTIDNGATTEQLRYLIRANAARSDARYRAAVTKGVEYLLRAQQPSGCWPQVYPLDGGYHDAATFNDDAIVNVLKLMRDVGRGERMGLGFVRAEQRSRAEASLRRGTDCIVAAQVVVNGKRTAWGQQHDPLTLVPVRARTYEPASLSGRESAGVVEFLMGLPSPDARVIEAVHAAVDWFRVTAIRDLVYDYGKGVRREPGAAPLWARMTEIGTNRPIFSNRDGITLYDYEQLTDRRTGYAWYTSEPGDVLARYDRWAAKHPRTTGNE